MAGSFILPRPIGRRSRQRKPCWHLRACQNLPVLCQSETNQVRKRPAKSSCEREPLRRNDNIIKIVWSVSSVHALCNFWVVSAAARGKETNRTVSKRPTREHIQPGMKAVTGLTGTYIGDGPDKAPSLDLPMRTLHVGTLLYISQVS